jgi:hypothetical protein
VRVIDRVIISVIKRFRLKLKNNQNNIAISPNNWGRYTE